MVTWKQADIVQSKGLASHIQLLLSWGVSSPVRFWPPSLEFIKNNYRASTTCQALN